MSLPPSTIPVECLPLQDNIAALVVGALPQPVPPLAEAALRADAPDPAAPLAVAALVVLVKGTSVLPHLVLPHVQQHGPPVRLNLVETRASAGLLAHPLVVAAPVPLRHLALPVGLGICATALVVLALVDVASELPLRVPVIAGPHGAHAAGLLAHREAVPIPPGMPSLLVLLAVSLRLPPLAVLHGRLSLRPVDHKPLRLVVVAPLDTLLAVAGLRAAAREPGARPAIPTLDALPISAPAFVHPADGDSTHEGTPAPVFGHFKLQLVDTFASTGLLTLGPVVPTPVTILVAAVAPRFPVGADICDFLPVVGFTHRLLCVAALGAAAGAGCCDQGVLLHLLLVLSDVGLGALHAVGSLRLLGALHRTGRQFLPILALPDHHCGVCCRCSEHREDEGRSDHLLAAALARVGLLGLHGGSLGILLLLGLVGLYLLLGGLGLPLQLGCLCGLGLGGGPGLGGLLDSLLAVLLELLPVLLDLGLGGLLLLVDAGGPRLAEAASLGTRPLQPGISPAASTRRPLAVPTSLPPSTIPVECLPLQDNIAALVVGALPQPVPPLAEAALRADAPDPAAPLAVAALVVLVKGTSVLPHLVLPHVQQHGPPVRLNLVDTRASAGLLAHPLVVAAPVPLRHLALPVGLGICATALVVLALVDVASELPLRVPVIAGPHGAHAAGLLAQREAVPIPPGMPSLLVLLAVALRLPPLAVLHGRLNLRPVDHKPLRLVVVAPLDTLLAVAGLRAAAREPGARPAIPTLDALPISAPAFVHPADGDSTHEGTPAPVFGHFKLQLVDTFASTGLLTLGPVVPTPVTILVAAVAPRFPVGADICDFLPVVGFTHRLLCVAALGAAAGAGCCDQGVLLHLLLVLSDVGLGALHA